MSDTLIQGLLFHIVLKESELILRNLLPLTQLSTPQTLPQLLQTLLNLLPRDLNLEQCLPRQTSKQPRSLAKQNSKKMINEVDPTRLLNLLLPLLLLLQFIPDLELLPQLETTLLQVTRLFSRNIQHSFVQFLLREAFLLPFYTQSPISSILP